MSTTAISDAQKRAGAPPNATTSPSVWKVVGRCLIAAVGMMACAMSPSLLDFIPGFGDWMTAKEAEPLGLTLFAASLLVLAVPLVSAAILLSVVARFSPISWRDIIGRRSARFSFGALCATTAVSAVLTASVIGVLHLAGVDADRATDSGTAGVPILVVIVMGLARAFLLQGIQEELWFRGFASFGAEKRPWLVLAATTLGFTALHLTSSGGQQSPAETVLYLVLPLGMGFWAGVERLRGGSVWPAIGVHGGMHTGLIVVALAGWPMGPAAWIAVGSIFLTTGALRLKRAN